MAETVRMEVETIDLAGGRVLRVCRFHDPDTDRTVLTLAKTWSDGGPMPGRRESAVELPGACRGELVAALRALGEEP